MLRGSNTCRRMPSGPKLATCALGADVGYGPPRRGCVVRQMVGDRGSLLGVSRASGQAAAVPSMPPLLVRDSEPR